MNKFIIMLLTVFFIFSQKVYAVPDFSSTYSIPIEMNILEEISTKNGIIEGSKLKFKVIKNVEYKGKIIIKKDEIITAKVETVVEKGMNGFPAEIIIDNFEISGIDKMQLLSTYTKKGFNKCYLVYPLKWALTPIPGVGSLTNFIKGGEAKIKTKDIIVIQYFPEWK